jgi:signal transduction histidine kinase
LDLSAFTERLLADLAQDLEGTRVVASVTPGIRVEADEERLTQALTALIANSVARSPERAAVHLELRREGSEAIMRIEDEGPTPDSVELEQAFSPFRGLAALEDAPSGAGLGVHIAKGIVEAHGGWVRCEPVEDGPGVVCEIGLPLEPPGPV